MIFHPPPGQRASVLDCGSPLPLCPVNLRLPNAQSANCTRRWSLSRCDKLCLRSRHFARPVTNTAHFVLRPASAPASWSAAALCRFRTHERLAHSSIHPSARKRCSGPPCHRSPYGFWQGGDGGGWPRHKVPAPQADTVAARPCPPFLNVRTACGVRTRKRGGVCRAATDFGCTAATLRCGNASTCA